MSMSENVIPQMTCKVTYQLRENDFANSVTKCKKRLKRDTEPSFAMQLTFYVCGALKNVKIRNATFETNNFQIHRKECLQKVNTASLCIDNQMITS